MSERSIIKESGDNLEDDKQNELQESNPKRGELSKPHEEPSILSSIIYFYTAAPVISVMLIFVPIGIALGATNQNGTAVFVLNFFGIIPLAKMLGEATEQLALHTNQSLGGLLNATFGNAVEIIIAIIALKEGLVRVVQASLIGSILSNLLLVLGMCFVAGGIYFPVMKFNSTAAQTSSGVLFLAVLAVVVPAALKAQADETVAVNTNTNTGLNITNNTQNEGGSATSTMSVDSKLLLLSRGTALVMLIIYGLFLFFQLHTHKMFYADSNEGEGEGEVEEEEHAEMTLPVAIFMLSVVTVFVAVCSEYLVGSIEAITKAWGISETFAGMILLPIVGNAAEHLTAVSVAVKNKLDLSIGVAVGSSQQIAMMVVPLMVVLGWIMNQPMSLYFHSFETVVLFMTVIVVHTLIMDGESNWLEGAMLIAVYVILGIAFYVL